MRTCAATAVFTPARLPGAVRESIPDVSRRVAERADVAWSAGADGLVHVERRKFGAAGSRLLGLFGVKPTLTVHLDALGSEVWKLLDGRRTVGEVLEALRAGHPDEDGLPERLGVFLGRAVSNGLVRLR